VLNQGRLPPGRQGFNNSWRQRPRAREISSANLSHVNPKHCSKSKLEAAYYKADKAIQEIVDLLAAA
jgi:hypothetical protein